ncbi:MULTISPECIES: LysE family translocator [unclassified Streptomyces]|uniref:LysE family translocator n=1 Tax=unclassified Streptomyces TaxID=2593676 RepID=UPI002254B332|nr:LysE family translocator [Streptomyces sp. NBC_00047]MCX5612642.1 LysE family translocator [Streptomyces sp. NBC_00047]
MSVLSDPQQLLLFVGASAALVGLPGPNLVYICTRSVAQGTGAGMVSALGVETGTVIHALATAFGVAALVSAEPAALKALTLLGAAYLLYLGIRSLTGAGSPGNSAQPVPRRLWSVYREGILVNVLNPKVMLFFLAFLPQWVSQDASGAQTRTELLILAAITFTVALAMDLGYAATAGALGRRLRGRAAPGRGRARYLVALVYLGLAAAAMFS